MPVLATNLPSADQATPIQVGTGFKGLLEVTPIYQEAKGLSALPSADQLRVDASFWLFVPVALVARTVEQARPAFPQTSPTELQREVQTVLGTTGWSIRTLASVIKISQPSLSAWSRGETGGSSRSNTQQQTLHAIADAIDRVRAIAGDDATVKNVLARSGALQSIAEGRLGSGVAKALELLYDPQRQFLIEAPEYRKRPAALIAVEDLAQSDDEV